jgi:hypothetical protein
MQFNSQFGIASAPSSQLSWGQSESTMSAYDEKKSGIGAICETWSFPRKRESTPQTFGNVPSSDWIPAFAGMTGGSGGFPLQMTPAPEVVCAVVCA